MADDAGVMDAPLDVGGEVDLGVDAAAAQGTDKPAESETGNKFSKEYRDAVKAWRDSVKDNPNLAKVARTAYDYHGQIEALKQLDPKGVTGVRETYALIQAAGGPQSITEMQQRLSDYDQTDSLLAAGDPKAFEALGEDFNEGLAKLAPAYLDRIAKANPEAYAAAILPHLMTSLTQSELAGTLDQMIEDIQNGGYDEKTKLARLAHHLTRASKWFEAQSQRAGQMKTPQANPDQDKFQQERTQFEQQKTEHFWNTQVKPDAIKYENETLEKHFRVYADRLNLPAAAKQRLFADFKAGLNQAGSGDEQYMKQMKLYRSAKTPDAKAIQTFVRNSIDKHSKAIVDQIVSERYGNFLRSKPGPKPGTPQAKPSGGQAPIIVPSKPSREEVNWAATKRLGRMFDFVYVLNNGKTVQYRKA